MTWRKCLEGPTLAVVAVVIACTDATGPRNVTGTYVLAAVDERALPSLQGATVEADTYLVEGSLALDSAGRFTMTLQTMLDTRTGGPYLPGSQWVYTGTYRLDGQSITMDWVSAPFQRRTFSGTANGSEVKVSVTDGRVFVAVAALAFARPVALQPVG